MQASPSAVSNTWLEEIKALLAELPEESLMALPEHLFAVVSLHPIVLLVAVYIQLASVFLCWRLRRSLNELRAQLVSLESRYESSLRRYEVRIMGLERRLATMPDAPPEAESPQQPIPRSKRDQAVQMVRQGAGPSSIAGHLDLRPAEVDLLLRMGRIERSGKNGR